MLAQNEDDRQKHSGHAAGRWFAEKREFIPGRGVMSQAAKVLLIYAHPESQDSVANRVLLKPATQLENVTVHDLYARYPDFFIDIPYEQALLREHDVIVFQHPLYTYSCPALLKEWLDRVLSRGFARGAAGGGLSP